MTAQLITAALKVAFIQKILEDFYLFTDLSGKFKFSAQDSDLEYLFWRSKNPPVSSDLKPPLVMVALIQKTLENFYIVKINIPNHYPEQKI